jgi:hypothetical protein
MKMQREFVEYEGNGRRAMKRWLFFCDGNGDGNADNGCDGNDDGNDQSLFAT